MSLTLFPTPSPEGIAKLKAFYRDTCQMQVSDDQADAVLSGIMRFLYLTRLKPHINGPTLIPDDLPYDPPSGPEAPPTPPSPRLTQPRLS